MRRMGRITGTRIVVLAPAAIVRLAGFAAGSGKLARDTQTSAYEDQGKIGGGAAYRINGRRNNLMALVARLERDSAANRMQHVVQWQVFTS